VVNATPRLLCPLYRRLGLQALTSSMTNLNGRAVSGEGLRPTACWDCRFESRRGQGCLCCVLHVKARGKEQDNQHTDTSTDEVQSTRDVKTSVSYERRVLLGRRLSLLCLSVIMKTTTGEGVSHQIS
jgi:hypothetical protein